jgi:hypothetical protein
MTPQLFGEYATRYRWRPAAALPPLVCFAAQQPPSTGLLRASARHLTWESFMIADRVTSLHMPNSSSGRFPMRGYKAADSTWGGCHQPPEEN